MSERIQLADLRIRNDAEALLAVLDSYVQDPIIAGAPFDPEVREQLVPALLAHPTTLVWIAREEAQPVGALVGFLGFSTFRAKPLLNVHDLAVVPERRGQQLGERLLATAEAHARSLGCCKLTLEVQERNERALALYHRVGFGHFAPGVEQNPTAFLEKPLS